MEEFDGLEALHLNKLFPPLQYVHKHGRSKYINPIVHPCKGGTGSMHPSSTAVVT